MEIKLGNITFSQVEDKLGFKLTDEDKLLWDEFHSNAADLSEKPSCFHIFELPLCIDVKGEDAVAAIRKMFASEKMVKAIGTIPVYQK